MNQAKATPWHGLGTMTHTNLGFKHIFQNAPFAGAGLVGLTLVCWLYFLTGAGTGMSVLNMSVIGIPSTILQAEMPASDFYIGVIPMVLMWWTMMLAMMMPGAFKHHPTDASATKSAAVTLLSFWLSYASIWLVFSVLVTFVHYLLVDLNIVHGMKMWSVQKWFNIFLLVIAGLYQFSPIKKRSLANCHASPQDGAALARGGIYGLNCLISSLPLMLLLFVGGVMNIYWVGLLTAIVTLEKLLPNPRPFSLAIGIASIATAIVIAFV